MNGSRVKVARNDRLHLRQGSLMVVVLVVITIVGALGSQLASNTETQHTRSQEEQLRHVLARIRNAFDMKKKVDEDFAPDLSSPAAIRQTLEILARENFLGTASLTDPLVRPHLWNSHADFFWKGTENVSMNSSFESDDAPETGTEVVASWSRGDPFTIAASDTRFFPTRNTDGLDDYRFQNKLGQTMTASGTSLRVDN